MRAFRQKLHPLGTESHPAVRDHIRQVRSGLLRLMQSTSTKSACFTSSGLQLLNWGGPCGPLDAAEAALHIVHYVTQPH